MSILNDLETTLDNGTNYVTRNKIFDVLFDDMVKLLNCDLETRNSQSPFSRFVFFNKESYINRIKSSAKQSFSMVRLYELLNHFGLSDNELKLFLNSDYIHIYQTEYRAYDMEYGTSIDFNSDIDLIYQYLENPEAVAKWYAQYAHIDFCKKFARAFRKQILSLNVIVNDIFWNEFSEYISNKPLEWYD
jgi:hypothetical protein